MQTFNSLHGLFLDGATGWWIAGTVIAVLALGFTGAPLILWALVLGALLIGFGAPLWLLATFAVVMAIFLITPIRRVLISWSTRERLSWITELSSIGC